MASPLTDWISAQAAAKVLGVSRPRIHQLVRAKVLEGARVAGRLVVHRSSLENFAASRRGHHRTATQLPMTLNRLREKRAQILSLAAARGARDICVFGSVARGEARLGSDIDFLVKMEPDRNVLDLCELMVDLEEELDRRVDVIEILDESPIAARIRQEAVPL
jgi:excisionase family DNA binding protein